MTRIIRSDLEGVVHAHLHDGTLNAVVLGAGDVVPDGVVVGDHLIAPEQDDVETSGADPAQARGKSAEAGSGSDPADPADPDQPDQRADEDDEDDEDDELDELDDQDEVPETEPADDVDEDTGDELSDDEGDQDEGLDAPRGNARTEEWAEYADALGVEYEPDATRTEIQAAIAASKSKG